MPSQEFPSAEEDAKKALEFLREFERNGVLEYMDQLVRSLWIQFVLLTCLSDSSVSVFDLQRDISKRERKVLEIRVDDISDVSQLLSDSASGRDH